MHDQKNIKFQTKFEEKIKTHTLRALVSFSENRVVCGTMCKNTLQADGPHTVI
jgi:hypothetical protein